LSNKGNIAGTKMWLLVLLGKKKGMRCGDALKLRNTQITIKEDEVIIKPTWFKNCRTSGRWLFTIKRGEGMEDIGEAIKRLQYKKKKEKSVKMFGNWNTNTVSYYFRKHEKKIGERLSLHKIRVLNCLIMTALGWEKTNIMTALNWKAEQSLNTYRQGFEWDESMKTQSMEDLYNGNEETKNIRRSIEQWKNRFKIN